MLKNLFFKTWFPHWSPDAALRYIPIVSEIKKLPPATSILDVGSGTLGITPYLKRPVTGVDTVFTGPQTKLLKQIRGSADKLPFAAKSFDVVIAVDVLEHIPPKKRRKVVQELLRVARHKIFLVFPTGRAAAAEDQWFAALVQQKYGKKDPYLDEHVRYGLPAIKIVLSYISNRYQVVIKNNVNVGLHRLILRAQFADGRLGRFISSVIFVFLTPLFSLYNLPPTYRKIIMIDKQT